MISLNDVLLAMSNIPVDDPIAEIWGHGLQSGYKIVEYTGALPITINADGNALLDYCIYGNTEQTGIPTPENPIMPEGAGEKTENLCPNIVVISDGYIRRNLDLYTVIKGLIANTNYKISWQYESTGTSGAIDQIRLFENATEIKAIQNGDTFSLTTEEISKMTTVYAYFGVQNTNGKMSNFMLSLGSTALPYEPYGYKLPITVSDGNTIQTVPIYLGEAQTTRRIKKLVLTGEETFVSTTVATHYRCRTAIVPKGILNNTTKIISTHYAPSAEARDGTITLTTDGGSIYFTDDINAVTKETFKSYLAAQYAAGTPVTVWYVLAEPETAVVNEPLMKIEDYADTVSMEQAGVSIPTNKETTIIDYDGTPKPSQMYVKYKGEE